MGKNKKYSSSSSKKHDNNKKNNRRPTFNAPIKPIIDSDSNDEDPFDRQQNKILFNTQNQYSSESEFSDQSILNLPFDSNDQDNFSMEDDNEELDEEEYDDQDDNEEYNDEELEDDEQENFKENKWGKRKETYYSADKNAIEDEYEEVCRLQKKKSLSQNLTNFLGNKSTPSLFGKIDSSVIQLEPSEDEDPIFPQIDEKDIKSKVESLTLQDPQIKKLYDELEMLLDQLNNHLRPLVAKLTEQEERETKMEMEMEMETIIKRDNLSRGKIVNSSNNNNNTHSSINNTNSNNSNSNIQKNNRNTSSGLDFLQAKCQLLAGYCTNIGYYLWIRINGASTKEHGIMKKLAKYRLLLEKMKPIEVKLGYQINKLIQASTHSSSNSLDSSTLIKDPLFYKPNIEGLNRKNLFLSPNASNFASKEMLNGDKDDGNDFDEDGDGKNLYKPPKTNPMHYHDYDAEQRNEKNKARRIDKKSRFEMELQEELMSDPEEVGIDPVQRDDKRRIKGKGENKGKFSLDKSIKEKKDYEEENFIRFDLSKKEKNRIRQSEERLVDDLDELDAYMDEMEEYSNKKGKQEGRKIMSRNDQEDDEDENGNKDNEDDEDEKIPSHSSSNYLLSDESEIEDDQIEIPSRSGIRKGDRNDRFDSFLSRGNGKGFPDKNYNSSRGKVEKRGNGNFRKLIDMKSANEKRPINRDMMKNRGLVLNHRSKHQSNPRVKQRHRFEKAQKRLRGFKPIMPNAPPRRYEGERTGIRSNISKSIKF